MSSIKRRHFLQATGSTIAAIGLSQFDLFQAQRVDRVLAQGKPGRKLALLVGINGYNVKPLYGCHTDVELQWELLVHRYGFSPSDILVVADREFSFLNYKPDSPTRQNILDAFERHLINQATSDTTVVFHYSGHGGTLEDPKPLPSLLTVDFDGNRIAVPNTKKESGTIMPLDHASQKSNESNDIMGKTLFLLTTALAQKTQNITLVLDSCHSGGSFRGNLNVRTVDRDNTQPLSKPSAIELDYQKRWMSQLKIDDAEFQKRRIAGIAAGVAIGSVQYDQLAADARFDGFSAGALTYTLTRYLWQQSTNESIDTVFANIASRTQEIGRSPRSDQKPLFDVSADAYRKQPLYLISSVNRSADAVVRKVVSGDEIVYWMGGVSSRNLAVNQPGTLYGVLDKDQKEIAVIEHRSREKLEGYGKLVKGDLKNIAVGTTLREKVRGLPTDLKIKIGLDPSLGQDLEKAKEVLSKISRVKVVESNDAMDFRLGRVIPSYKSQFATFAPDLREGSIGLFSHALTPLTATFGPSSTETITDGIDRLKSRIQSLLATMVLKAMGGIDMGAGGKNRSLTIQVEPTGRQGRQVGVNQFAPETMIRVRVKNTSEDPLYVGVISIGGSGNLRVLYPYFEDLDSAEESARLRAGKELVLPEPGINFPLSKDAGTIELLVFTSKTPIRDAIRGLKDIASRGRSGLTGRSAGFSREAMVGSDAVDAFSALLGDVDRGSRSGADIVPTAAVRAIDVNQFGLVSTMIQIVK